jgi:hypothetical protein
MSTKPTFKPGTIGAIVQELGTKNPKMTAEEMHKAVLAAGKDCAKSTVDQLRSVLGFVDATRSAAVRKAIALKTGKRGSKKGVKRGPYKKPKAKAPPAPNGHASAPAPASDARASFAALVRRIGTDAAHELLRAAESDV